MRKQELIEAIKFGFVGLSNSLVTFLVFNFLLIIHMPYLISNIIGYFFGMVNSYFWNHRYVFKKKATKQNIVKFVMSNLCMMVFSSFCLYCFVTFFSLEKRIAMLFSMIISMGLNFLITKFWIFNDGDEEQ